MIEFRFTLIGEGSSDEALVSVLQWLLQQHLPQVTVRGQFPDFGHLTDPPPSPAARIVRAVEMTSCALLFVHRDGDTAGRVMRVSEIERTVAVARQYDPSIPTVVPVIPVRMLEAWLLTDELAIRRAVSNPNGRTPLQLPRIRDLESLPDPKSVLRQAIHQASELRARRARHVRVSAVTIARATADFAALRILPAFQALEADVERIIQDQGWPGTLPDQP